MNQFNHGDIVRFAEEAECRAAIFCRNRGITGRVVGEEYGVYAIEVGFPYLIYIRPQQIEKIIGQSEVPEIIE